MRTKPGGMIRLVVIVAVWPLEQRAEHLCDGDECHARHETNPRPKSKCAIDAEVRMMLNGKVGEHEENKRGNKQLLEQPDRRGPREPIVFASFSIFAHDHPATISCARLKGTLGKKNNSTVIDAVTVNATTMGQGASP